MKRDFFLFLMVFLCFSCFVNSQSKSSFGINGGLAIPRGNLSEFQDIGFQIGGNYRIASDSSIYTIVMGASYTELSGKEINAIKIKSFNPFNIFAGLQFGKQKGLYFLPAITCNF